MKDLSKKFDLIISLSALVAVIGLLSPRTVVRAASDNEEQVSKMLSDAKAQAFQLKEDAEELWLYTLVPPSASSVEQISVDSHTESLHRISADVSAMTVQMAKLESARRNATLWQIRDDSYRGVRLVRRLA